MERQLETILNKLFDDGQNAQYRVGARMITFADSEDKKKKDVAFALEQIKKLLG